VAYACDITYGTAKEFGFDFLRDRLLLRRMGVKRRIFWATAAANVGTRAANSPCSGAPTLPGGRGRQHADRRSPHAADHRLAGRQGARASRRHVSVGGGHAPSFVEDEHYDYDHDTKKVELTASGPAIPAHAAPAGTAPQRRPGRPVPVHRTGDQGAPRLSPGPAIRRPRRGNRDRRRVHRTTGRRPQMARRHPPGDRGERTRRGHGAHGQAARITVQDLFLRYRTWRDDRHRAHVGPREFRKIYKMRVIAVPTNKPVQRQAVADADLRHQRPQVAGDRRRDL
jgi:preprotein translocase subunit SecA